jgi:DNA uptake protein ComE-like DNA-binding protein
MKLFREPIKNWFGFTRRERRSTFILLILVVLIIGIKYSVPDSQIEIRDITGTVIQAVDLNGLTARDNSAMGISYSREIINVSGDTSHKASRNYYRSNRIATGKGRAYNFNKHSPAPQKQLTDINLSDSAELMKLPGIGPVLSVRIIKYRNYLGGFVSIGQLKEVYGLSEETFEMIKTSVRADSSFITRININTADYKELTKVRYLEKYEITSILKYRKLKGRINSITDLFDNKLITSEKAKKVGPYLRFE